MIGKLIISALAGIILIAGSATAENLDPKWAEMRKEANALGDAALAGDDGARNTLIALSVTKNPAAIHNLGWLAERMQGIGLGPACDYYYDAAELEYPPSLHAGALCLLKVSEPGDDPNSFIPIARNWLTIAAQRGWTASAVTLGEYILKLSEISRDDAQELYFLADSGMRSLPTQAQAAKLKYFGGMSVILDGGVGSYQSAEKDFIYAIDNDHPEANAALQKLYTKWATYQIDEMTKWEAPDISDSPFTCVMFEQLTSDKTAALKACKDEGKDEEEKLQNLLEKAEYLNDRTSGETSDRLSLAISELRSKSKNFIDTQNEFRALYVEEMGNDD